MGQEQRRSYEREAAATAPRRRQPMGTRERQRPGLLIYPSVEVTSIGGVAGARAGGGASRVSIDLYRIKSITVQFRLEAITVHFTQRYGGCRRPKQ